VFLLLILQCKDMKNPEKKICSGKKKTTGAGAFLRILRTSAPFLLAVTILWWMYRGFDWDEVRKQIFCGMSWKWMLLSFPFGVMAQVFRAMRWRQQLKPLGERPRLLTCVNAVFISYASSLLVPRIGEVLRCGILKRYEGVNFSRSVGTVVTERLVDSLMMLALSLATFAVQIPVFMVFFRRTGISLEGFLCSFSAAGYFVTAVCAALVLLAFWRMFRRLGVFAKVKTILTDVYEGLVSVREVESRALYLIYSVSIWVCYYLHFYLTFYCFPFTETLGAMAALVAFVTGTFAVLVPTPNGAGPWHFVVKTVLALYGVGQAPAALFALTVHTLQTLLVALLGGYAMVALAFTRRTTSSGEDAKETAP